MCHICVQDLVVAYNLKQRCLQNDNHFKKQFNIKKQKTIQSDDAMEKIRRELKEVKKMAMGIDRKTADSEDLRILDESINSLKNALIQQVDTGAKDELLEMIENIKQVTTNATDKTENLEHFKNIIMKKREEKEAKLQMKEKLLCLAEKYQKDSHIKCCGCSKTFENSEMLQAHANDTHQRDLEIESLGSVVRKCTICYKVFYGDEYKEKHIGKYFSKRLEIINHPCCSCDEIFDTYEGAKEHAFLHNEGHIDNDPKKRYKCYVCSKSFAKLESLTHHLRKINDSDFKREHVFDPRIGKVIGKMTNL